MRHIVFTAAALALLSAPAQAAELRNSTTTNSTLKVAPRTQLQVQGLQQAKPAINNTNAATPAADATAKPRDPATGQATGKRVHKPVAKKETNEAKRNRGLGQRQNTGSSVTVNGDSKLIIRGGRTTTQESTFTTTGAPIRVEGGTLETSSTVTVTESGPLKVESSTPGGEGSSVTFSDSAPVVVEDSNVETGSSFTVTESGPVKVESSTVNTEGTVVVTEGAPVVVEGSNVETGSTVTVTEGAPVVVESSVTTTDSTVTVTTEEEKKDDDRP